MPNCDSIVSNRRNLILGPCLVPPVDLTPGLCPFPPPVQQRMPSSLSTNAQPSPVTSVKTTPLKPSVVPTFTPPPPNTCATSSPPSVLSKLLSESPNVQVSIIFLYISSSPKIRFKIRLVIAFAAFGMNVSPLIIFNT